MSNQRNNPALRGRFGLKPVVARRRMSLFGDRFDDRKGASYGKTSSSPWWVANNETETSTLYNGDGVAQFGATPLVVSVPGNPTGAVANPTGDFVVSAGGASGPARFIFVPESGTIRGWNPGG